MRKHRNTNTTKEFERTELLKLEGLQLFGVAKFTNGVTYAGNKALRLLTEIKIYKPNGEILHINHLYIPMDDTKKNALLWHKHSGSYRKFKGNITSYGFENKKASLNLDLENNIYKFRN